MSILDIFDEEEEEFNNDFDDEYGCHTSVDSDWLEEEAHYHIELIKNETGIDVECYITETEYYGDDYVTIIVIRFASKEDLQLFKITFNGFKYNHLIIGDPGSKWKIPLC